MEQESDQINFLSCSFKLLCWELKCGNAGDVPVPVFWKLEQLRITQEFKGILSLFLFSSFLTDHFWYGERMGMWQENTKELQIGDIIVYTSCIILNFQLGMVFQASFSSTHSRRHLLYILWNLHILYSYFSLNKQSANHQYFVGEDMFCMENDHELNNVWDYNN